MSTETLAAPAIEQRVVTPDFVAGGVLDIDFQELHDRGQTHLLIDLDLTSRRAYSRHIDPDVADYIRVQRERGLIDAVSIASNNETDISGLAAELGAQTFQPFTRNNELIKKPDPRFFERILTERGITADQAVMVGDRYQHDVVGAGQMGITTVLVRPLGSDYISDRLGRTRRGDQRALSAARTIVAAQTFAPSLHGDALEKAMVFDRNLQRAQPYLFSLAGQVLDDYPRKNWDVLIGDDTSGRLVVRFIRQVLRQHGIELPTAYICTSYGVMNTLPTESYERLVDRIANSETKPRHPLVVSENTSTGNAFRFLGSVLGRHFETVDFALGAARFEKAVSGHSGDVYAGGIGRRAAEAMFSAFEEVDTGGLRAMAALRLKDALPQAIRSRIRRVTSSASRSSSPFTGIVSPDLSKYAAAELADVLPVSVLTPDRRYVALAAYSLRRMDELAAQCADQLGGEQLATSE